MSLALGEPDKGEEAVPVVCKRKGKFYKEYRRKGDPKSSLTSHIDPLLSDSGHFCVSFSAALLSQKTAS